MLNQVAIVGRLTRNMDIRYTQDGKAVSNVAIAVPRNFRGINGEYKTDFVQCTFWGKIAEHTANYCGKGSVVGITGRISTRTYENSDLQTVYVTEVIAEKIQFFDKIKKPNSSTTNADKDLDSDELPDANDTVEEGETI